MKKYYADDVNFWKTSTGTPDKWIDLAKNQIKTLGGRVTAEGFGSDSAGRAAYMLGFEFEGETYKLVWPVLPSRRGEEKSARVQAVTMLYHYVKSVCLYAIVIGPRAAFFSHLLLPDGRTASQVATPELADTIPHMLLLTSGHDERN